MHTDGVLAMRSIRRLRKNSSSGFPDKYNGIAMGNIGRCMRVDASAPNGGVRFLPFRAPWMCRSRTVSGVSRHSMHSGMQSLADDSVCTFQEALRTSIWPPRRRRQIPPGSPCLLPPAAQLSHSDAGPSRQGAKRLLMVIADNRPGCVGLTDRERGRLLTRMPASCQAEQSYGAIIVRWGFPGRLRGSGFALRQSESRSPGFLQRDSSSHPGRENDG